MRKMWPFVFLLVVFFTTGAKADVTGSFDIRAALFPEGTQTEAVQFYFDIQSHLQLNVTISGMTFSADLGFGPTGPEFAVTGISANLGAVNVNDAFVFAVPFYNAGNYPGTGIPQISPTLDANGQPNGLAFVRKQVRTDLFIGGFVLSNLAIFEDVDFPTPTGTTNPNYYVGQFNSVVGDQTPTYGFGDVLTVRGETVSGLTIESTAGICASKSAKIVKKRAFQYKVNKACTATLGNIFDEADAIEGGAKTPLLFEFEELAVRNIEIGGVKFNLDARWLPMEGFTQANLNARFSLFDFATVSARATFAELIPLTLKSLLVTVNSDVLTLNLADTDADLTFDRLSAVFSATLNPNQNPATLQSVTVLARNNFCNDGFDKDGDEIDNCVDENIDGDDQPNASDDDMDGDGLDNMSDPDDNGDGVDDAAVCSFVPCFLGQTLTLSFNRGPFRFSSTTSFSPAPGTPSVAWSSTSFSLDYFPVENASFSAQATAAPTGLMPVSVSFGVVF